MRNLFESQRARLSSMIRTARESGGKDRPPLTQDGLAAWAERRIHGMAMEADVESVDEERDVWRRLTITRHHIAGLENCPARPLETPERRGRLLAVARVLGLDPCRVNRLAGGI